MLFSALLFLSSSCVGPRLWGQSRDELFLSLSRHDYSFLDGVEPWRYEDALKLGVESPYFLGLHFARADRQTAARAMFTLGVSKSPEPYASLCLRELTKTGTPVERLEALSRLLADVSLIQPAEVTALESLRVDLLIELGRFDEVPGSLLSWSYSHPVSERFAASFASMPSGYTPLFYEVVSSRIRTFRRDYQAAWEGAKAALESNSPDILSRPVLSDFGKAALYGSSDFRSSALFLDGRSAAIPPGEARYVLDFYAGRLYEQASMKAEARRRYESAMILAQNPADYDSALWYLLRLSYQDNLSVFLDDLGRYSPNFGNPAFFSDLLDQVIVTLVLNRDWQRIIALRAIAGKQTSLEIRTRLDYLAARSGILSPEATKEAFTAAYNEDHGSLYYRALSAEALGIAMGSPEKIVQKSDKKDPPPADGVSTTALLRGFLKWHLSELLYPTAVRLYPDLPVSLAKDLGAGLAAAGRQGDALRLALLALKSSAEPITDDDLRLIYPRPWSAEVSAAASRFKISEYLLYALIRTESYFQNDVTSTAGAIGLTQLMRPTAADVARKLKVDEYDLTDPTVNIAFGAFYLSELIGRMDGRVMPALFAYNAGITRVRSWQKTAQGLSVDLFLETLPYGETREYGRKVLAASAVYGYLYYQKSIGQTVREIF